MKYRWLWILVLLAVPTGLWAEGEDQPEEPEDPNVREKREREEREARKPGAIQVLDPGTDVGDSAIARRQVARFQKEWKAAKKDNEARIKALTRLGEWNHPEVCKALLKHIKHKEFTVAVAAIAAVGRQSHAAKAAGKKVMGVLKSDKRTAVICASLVTLGRLGYKRADGIKMAERFHRKDTGERHKAAARYFGYIKHKEAFRKLAEHLDEPFPANPNSPTNPPAAWWEARYKEWQSNVSFTRWAISQLIPDETFETESEAKQWAESEGSKHGIEWK